MSMCPHLEDLEIGPMPGGGCIDCLAIGGRWVHLRYCVECGGVRCCDDSPHRHARRHWQETGHPVIRSREPGEHWAWCYEHETGIRTAES